jgi:hypothetical protein
MSIRLSAPLATLTAALAVSLAAQAAPVRTFDADPPDSTPADFTFAAMRQPSAGVWRIGSRPGERFLVHDADPAATGYALALAPGGGPLRDLQMTARLKLAGGARAGGFVWRYQDPQNYYAVVLDLQAGVLSMHRIVDGNRITIEREDNLELDPGGWHRLKVVHDDASVYVSIGGIRVINERSRQLDRFGPGLAGLLATGDSEVWFDDLGIEPDRDRR